MDGFIDPHGGFRNLKSSDQLFARSAIAAVGEKVF
jgi:hypothetical protein